ncbi:MAG: PEP-CTERM sorting domain-containing protein [Verrucomicrobiales bacterium]
MKSEFPVMLTAGFLAMPGLSHAAFVLTEVGTGAVTLDSVDRDKIVDITDMVINPGDPEFGNHTTAAEGVYYTWSFMAAEDAANTGTVRFDVQNTMGVASNNDFWTGWGSGFSAWSDGPVTADWDRANRHMHAYSDSGSTRIDSVADAGVTNSGMTLPDVGDELRGEFYYNAIDDSIFSVFVNVTKGERFEHLRENVGGHDFTFSDIFFRSDSANGASPGYNPIELQYSYGTFVVPEPTGVALLGMAGLLGLRRRR